MEGLGKIRVIDFSSWIAGPYTSKLFADAGADIIKIESAQGDPLRKHAPTPRTDSDDSAFFQFLNASKRSVIGKPNDSHIIDLIASADLIIEDFGTNSANLNALNIPL